MDTIRSTRARTRAPLAALLVAAALLAGCGSDADGTQDPAEDTAEAPADDAEEAGDAGAADATIRIEDFAFTATTVAPGVTVTVVNADSATHTVTGDAFDVSVPGGEEATFEAPTEPGAYDFVCDIHPSMTGTLTVEG